MVIYTASLSIYAEPLLDEIDPCNYASYRLFREHCTFHNNAFVKDLSQLGRDLKDVIIVDNSPTSYSFQPENAIPILTWIDDMEDTKLYELAPVLELMVSAGDVREIIKEIVHNDTIDYIEAAEYLKRKFAPKPKPKPIMNNWTEPQQNDLRASADSKRDIVIKKKMPQEVSEATMKQNMKSALPDNYLAMGPLTPQYKKSSAPFVSLNKPVIASQQFDSKKHNVKKAIPSDDPPATTRGAKKTIIPNAARLENNTEDSPSKKRPITEHLEKRKKAGTPTPYSNNGLAKTAKNQPLVGNTKDKAVPLHKQPRQHSATGKKKGEMRAATPKNMSPKKELAAEIAGSYSKMQNNPAPNKAALFYSNLLKIKSGDGNSKKDISTNQNIKRVNANEEKLILSNHKENYAVGSSSTIPMKEKPVAVLGGSNILKGLEESANKKLNKHSSSLDNTDWMACYEKLRKEINLNSPKDAPSISGRVSVNSVRPNGVVLLGEYLPKRQLVTPPPFPVTTKSNAHPVNKPKVSGKVQTIPNKEKSSKPALVSSNEKFSNMMIQIGTKGNNNHDTKGMQRPVVLLRQKR